MESKSIFNRPGPIRPRFVAMAAFPLLRGYLVALLVGGGILLGGCRQDNTSAIPETSTAPADPVETPSAPATEAPQAAVSTPSAPQPPAVAPEPVAPEPVAQAPTNTGTSPTAATLPDDLNRQWEPASNVLFTFGAMTITPAQVQWSSGQSSAYRVVSTDGGYLLQLESSPVLYETPNPYIKLIPKPSEGGATTSMDVAFYESDAQAQSDDYIMYGSYFVE
jgi:hypothetical protein